MKFESPKNLEKCFSQHRVLDEDLPCLLLVLFDQILRWNETKRVSICGHSLVREEREKEGAIAMYLHLRHDIVELILRHSSQVRR